MAAATTTDTPRRRKPPAKAAPKPTVRKGALPEAVRDSAHAERILAGLRTLAVAMNKVAAVPEGDRQACFSAMLVSASDFSSRWLERLGIAGRDRDWASARLYEAFLHAAPAAPAQAGDGAVDSVLAIATSASAPPPPSAVVPDDAAPALHRLAMVAAMLPVCLAQAEFGFLRKNPEDDMEEVAAKVVAAADSLFCACTQGASPGAHAAEVRHAALACCGDLMATAWRVEAAVAQDVFARRAIDVRAWRRANPEGFPLSQVFKRFADQATVLERLVAKVAMKD